MIDPEVLAFQLSHEESVAKLREEWWKGHRWFFPRCKVRILIYADAAIYFQGGSFKGLQEVLNTLASSPWFWVEFAVTTAYRDQIGGASGAQIEGKTFDLLDITANYDEIWLFGDAGLPSYLQPAELSAITDFMNGGGGVLVTGDHQDLGAGLASAIPRVGKMRLWDPNNADILMRAPSAVGPDRHETLRSGHDNVYSFDDQSDDVGQEIVLRRYPLWGFPWWWSLRSAPHTVLCGPMGPIDVLPDHMHEGEAIVPTSFPASEWPSSSGGFQPKPEVIAWGQVLAEDPSSISMPDAGIGRPTPTQFGVIGAYNGHEANVGRVVADSTWHHWFDINLNGEPGNNTPGDPKATGFHSSAAGLATLEKIKAYYRNVAVWLAPPRLQSCMSHQLFWGALYLDPLIMISSRTPILQLGAIARDAFGKYAPQCTIYSWIILMLPPDVQHVLDRLIAEDVPAMHRLPDLILGHIVRALREKFPKATLPTKPPSFDLVAETIADAGRKGLHEAMTLQRAQALMIADTFSALEKIEIAVNAPKRKNAKPPAKKK